MAAHRDRFILGLAGVTVLYFLAGKIGLSLAFVNPSATAVWPASGIAVASLLLLGLRAWPAIIVGAFLVNVTTSGDIVSSIAIACGNTLEGVVAAALAIRFAHGRFAFERGPDVLRFTVLSGMLATMIGATVGTATLRFAGLASSDDMGLIWLTWWLGDATGIVLVAPMFTLWAAHQRPTRGGRIEGLLLVASLTVVSFAVFGTAIDGLRDMPLVFLMVPILLWSAFRFGSRMTSTMAVAASAIAVYRILHYFGPFSLGEPTVSLLIVQSFVGLLGILMLSVAAEVSVRHQVEADMRALNDTLERRVVSRTEDLTKMHGRLLEAQAVAHVGSWEWDIAADSLWWSDEMCRIFGVREPPSNYAQYLLTVHPEDRERTAEEVQHAADDHRAFSFEHRILRPDGEVRVLYASGRLEVDADGRPIRMMGIGHDITERKRSEEERAQLIREQTARREAEEANRAKDAFLATLSHELRTPLNAALGWAHILRESLHAEGRELRALQTIYRNLLIQSRLVSDILDVSRITKGGLFLESEVVDVTGVVDAAIEMVREAAVARNVTVEVRTSGRPIVTGDSRRLQQVAWNLLSNAVKFARGGGRVTVSIVGEGDTVQFSVEDDGPGIAPEFLPHVFEQFRQADASVTREHGGLGLGLAIAHHIVELHQGTIEVMNRTTGGAIFVVRLPGHRPPTGTSHLTGGSRTTPADVAAASS